MKLGTKILIIIMGVLLSSSLGFNFALAGSKGKVDVTKVVVDQFEKSVVKVIADQVPGMLKPIIADQNQIKEDVGDLKTNLSDLNKSDIRSKTGRAISAYSKVFTIEDLKNSPEKRFSIIEGLEIDSCYTTLLNIDHDRTVLFYRYLIRDAL